MNLCDGITVLSPSASPVGAGDFAQTVTRAVEQAMTLLGPCRELTVLVNDPQRHTSSGEVLAEVAKHADPSRIHVLVATGTHAIAPAQRQAMETEIRGRCPVRSIQWHDCRQKDLVPIGTAMSGQLWKVNPIVLEARPVLAIGSVEPHYFAGFTGAHKTCTIGVASHDDTQANHAGALSPASGPCRLEGNPVYDGIAAMLASLESKVNVAAVNLVQVGRRIVFASGGRCLDALGGCVAPARDAFVQCIPAPADALLLDVTGALAVSFYQAEKGIKNNELAVRDGGVLVLLADCPAGIGQDHFVSLLREAPTYAAAVETVNRRGYRLGDHKAVKLRYLTDARGVRVYIVSKGLGNEDAAVLGLRKAASAAAALAEAGIALGRDRVYRLEDAGNMCVVAG